jgi:hypothetical protein
MTINGTKNYPKCSISITVGIGPANGGRFGLTLNAKRFSG